MKPVHFQKWSRLTIMVVLLNTLLFPMISHAGMVSTYQALTIEQHYDKHSLLSALNDKAVQEKLISLGVDADLVAERVKHMTPDELAYLNQHINEMETGEGVLGVLVLIFLVFIVTDMLCATDIYSFVNCINK